VPYSWSSDPRRSSERHPVVRPAIAPPLQASPRLRGPVAGPGCGRCSHRSATDNRDLHPAARDVRTGRPAPLLVITLAARGSTLFGFVGLLLAIPVAAVAKACSCTTSRSTPTRSSPRRPGALPCAVGGMQGHSSEDGCDETADATDSPEEDDFVKSAEIRESFLAYFESKGCKRLPSSSLVPDDPRCCSRPPNGPVQARVPRCSRHGSPGDDVPEVRSHHDIDIIVRPVGTTASRDARQLQLRRLLQA